MQLSERLQAIVNEVPSRRRIADVGCDHAYTSIYLARYKEAEHIIAMDIKKGPLKKAVKNIREAGLEDQIETRLSDGVLELKVGEVNTIVMSGIGGILMMKILSQGSHIVSETDCLVLQPQSELSQVRKYLHRIGFGITRECMVIEDGKFYTIIHANKEQEDRYSETEYEFGKYLLYKRDEVLYRFLIKEEKKTEKIISNLEKYGKGKEKQKRIKEVRSYLEIIEKGYCFFSEE